MTTQLSYPFTAAEQMAMAAIVGQIIPASDEFSQPCADDPEILNEILTSGATLQGRLASALASLVGKAVDATQAADFRRSFPAEAELVQTLTVQCYYRDARIMRALNVKVRPPFPGGYVQEPND